MAEPHRRFVLATDPVRVAAQLLAAAIEEADRTRGHARLAIAGGSALAALAPARALLAPGIWDRLRLTWVDERRVPEASEDSNRGAALRAGALGEPAIVLPLFFDGESPDAAVRRVDEELHRDFDAGIDVALLGMGEDGHIASLFPGHPSLQARGLAVAIVDSPKPPPERISLTLPLLAASHAVLLAHGEPKRSALERLQHADPALPASRLERLDVVTDLELGGER